VLPAGCRSVRVIGAKLKIIAGVPAPPSPFAERIFENKAGIKHYFDMKPRPDAGNR